MAALACSTSPGTGPSGPTRGQAGDGTAAPDSPWNTKSHSPGEAEHGGVVGEGLGTPEGALGPGGTPAGEVAQVAGRFPGEGKPPAGEGIPLEEN